MLPSEETRQSTQYGSSTIEPINRRAETKPRIVRTRAVLITFVTTEDRKVVFQNHVVLKGTH